MKKAKFEDLVKIMERLRGNDGCPWDKEQNRKSLKPYLIEESYEVLEAIDEGKPEKIKEELGDLLFQILFHAQISKDMGEFRRAFSDKNTEEMENELGDLLFALVNIARFIEVNPEDALRKTISRFIKRFHYIEEEIAKQGRELKNVSLEEMDKLWDEAKEKENI